MARRRHLALHYRAVRHADLHGAGRLEQQSSRRRVWGRGKSLVRSAVAPALVQRPAFAPVPATDAVTGLPRFGNAGRNIILGPGLAVLDATLGKSIRLREGASLTFRLEAFNLMNHFSFDLPQVNISQTNLVGTINGVVTPARQAQLAVLFDF